MGLLFDANGELVNHGSAASLDNVYSGTVMAWFNLTSLSGFSKFIASKNGATVTWDFQFTATNGFIFNISRATTSLLILVINANLPLTLTAGEWTCYAVSFNTSGADADQTLYAGTLATNMTATTTYTVRRAGSNTEGDNSGANFTAGNNTFDTTGFLNGILAELCIVSGTPLTQGQIIDWQRRPRKLPGSVLYSSYNDYGGGVIVPDWSGRGNGGTLTGTPTQARHVPLPPLPTWYAGAAAEVMTGGSSSSSPRSSSSGISASPVSVSPVSPSPQSSVSVRSSTPSSLRSSSPVSSSLSPTPSPSPSPSSPRSISPVSVSPVSVSPVSLTPSSVGPSLLTALGACYSLDEANGTSPAYDSTSGATHLTTITGTPTVVAGKISNARSFGANAAVAQTSDSTRILCGANQDWSVGFWLKFDANALQPASVNLAVERTSEILGRVEPTSGGKISLLAWNGSAYQGINDLQNIGDNNWHLCVFRWNSTTRRMRMWLDTANVRDDVLSGAFTYANGAAANRLRLGTFNTVGPLALDNLGVWSSTPGGGGELSDALVTAFYNAGSGVSCNQFGTPSISSSPVSVSSSPSSPRSTSPISVSPVSLSPSVTPSQPSVSVPSSSSVPCVPPAIVQQFSKLSVNSSTNVESTAAVAVTTGNALAVCCTWGSDAGFTGAVTDGVNTFTSRVKADNPGADGVVIEWFVADAIVGGTRALTLTLSGNADRPSLYVYEIARLANPSYNTSAGGTGSDAAPTPGPLTTTWGDVVILSGVRNLQGNTYTAGNWGATLDSGDFRAGMQSKLVLAKQTGLVANTVQSGANQWATAAIALRGTCYPLSSSLSASPVSVSPVSPVSVSPSSPRSVSPVSSSPVSVSPVSLSSSPGFVFTNCCPGVGIPTTIYLEIQGTTCDGSYPMTWNAGQQRWETSGAIGSCSGTPTPVVTLACVGSAFQVKVNGVVTGGALSTTCSPFELTLTGASMAPCCNDLSSSSSPRSSSSVRLPSVSPVSVSPSPSSPRSVSPISLPSISPVSVSPISHSPVSSSPVPSASPSALFSSALPASPSFVPPSVSPSVRPSSPVSVSPSYSSAVSISPVSISPVSVSPISSSSVPVLLIGKVVLDVAYFRYAIVDVAKF